MSSVFTQLKPELRKALIKFNDDREQIYNDKINLLNTEEYYHKLPYHVFVLLQSVSSLELDMNLKDFTFFHQMLDK
jgi:hypothetical protein